MKITVISDTHMPTKAKSLPTKVLSSIQRSDLLIHAGDFTAVELLNYLEKLTHVEGVAGNNDGPELVIRLGKKKIIERHGYRIGLIHGDGFHGTTLQRVKQAFANDRVDIVIFGHTHQPYNKKEDGVIYFNPGSPTNKRKCPKHSYGEIILGDTIKTNLFYF